MTWPLVRHFTTGIPGGGEDDQTSLWNYWWVKHALVDLKTNPFYTDFVFYPHKTGLYMHNLVLLNGVLSIPLQYIMPLPAVYNLFLLLSFALSGLGACLLADRFVTDKRAAFMAGLIFASYRTAYIYWTNFSMTQWVPFYLFFLLKALDDDDGWIKNSVWAGIFLVFSFYSDYYHSLSAFIFSAVIFIYYLASGASRPGRLIKRFLPAIIISLPFVMPVVIAVFRAAPAYRLEKWQIEKTWISRDVADLAGFFSPYRSNPVLGRFSFRRHLTGNENYSYLGLTALAFSVYSLFSRPWNRGKKFWLISFLVFTVLAMGPYLHVLGRQLPIPLPFKLLSLSGFLSNFRSPVRLSIYAVLALSTLAAFGMERAFRSKAFIFPLLIPVILIEYAAPYPTFECSVPPAYQTIAADKNAQAVLEIPAHIRHGFEIIGKQANYVLYYQSVHGKKLFNGYLARVPEKTFWSYFNLPVYRSLLMMSTGEFAPAQKQKAIEADKAAAPDFLDLFGVDYVVVHRIAPGQMETDPEAEAEEEYLNQVLPMQRVYGDPWLVVYKTIHKPSDETSVQAASAPTVPYFYDGWINGQMEDGRGCAWATGEKSVLLANLRPALDYVLALELKPAHGLKDDNVEIGINGNKLQTISLKDGWNVYTIKIPAALAENGLNRIYFKPASAVRPDRPFKGIWPEFTTSLPEPPYPTYWEQDNSKFGDAPVSFALSRFSIRPAP